MSMEIGIAGLGLIGGSMARALKAYTAHRVRGADTDPETLSRARADGAMDGPLDDDALSRCDVVLLALYPGACAEYVRAHAPFFKKGACVTDLCGVKRAVGAPLAQTARAHGFFYVGGHPMAGLERSGYAAARAELFRGASMILTPEADTPRDILSMLETLFCSIGFAGVRLSSPAEHDRMIAYTSQLAHILSSAYVKSPSALRHAGFSAGSFQDMTRVATLNETMWTELFLLNGDYLLEEVDALCARLTEYGAALRAGDGDTLLRLLREGREWKESSLSAEARARLLSKKGEEA